MSLIRTNKIKIDAGMVGDESYWEGDIKIINLLIKGFGTRKIDEYKISIGDMLEYDYTKWFENFINFLPTRKIEKLILDVNNFTATRELVSIFNYSKLVPIIDNRFDYEFNDQDKIEDVKKMAQLFTKDAHDIDETEIKRLLSNMDGKQLSILKKCGTVDYKYFREHRGKIAGTEFNL